MQTILFLRMMICLEKAIIATAHIPQPPTDGNADLAAVDALSPGDFRLLDTGNVVGVNSAGLCRSGMSQSHRQSCNQVQAALLSCSIVLIDKR